jgi:hypothetical protein
MGGRPSWAYTPATRRGKTINIDLAFIIASSRIGFYLIRRTGHDCLLIRNSFSAALAE